MPVNQASSRSSSCSQSSSMKIILPAVCYVCGAHEAEKHFGGISCRACAAFFRRCCRSPKIVKKCSCGERKMNSHPCRSCRMKRCLEVGMDPENVDMKLYERMEDSISQMIINKTGSLLTVSFHKFSFNKYSIELNSDPHNIKRNLYFVIRNHELANFLANRDKISGGKILAMNLFELSSMTKSDTRLIWRMITNVFPSIENLKVSDQNALLRNFHLKLWLITTITFCMERVKSPIRMKTEEREKMIVVLYERGFKKGNELSRNKILKVFGPFWWWFIDEFVPPILRLNLEEEEVMALIWMLFFDHGYTNISSECDITCRNIKKVILLQLKNFQNERDFSEERFFKTLEVLEMFERLEKKFVEEMLFCEMQGVILHDDFKAILMENKF
ncbi:hypothetical protein CAEBREN_04282 [Caenorhabditis brenneri]|uniref:Nuclear receptor domain-containing protein n=1 Tax=Caenorhabditis brenneri TaxID=135651 RepID=G0NN21_CAEBE|nr:hypothetical protein CAEBREN_04282 [Caenorhabditis brenneri]